MLYSGVLFFIFLNVAHGSGNIDGSTSSSSSSGLTNAQLRASPVPVSGSFTTSLPAGGSTSALQTTGNSSLSSIDGKITAVNTGAVVVSSSALPAGAAQEHTTAGSPNSCRLSDGASFFDPRLVTVQNASIPVTGTFWQGTQPVSGTVSLTASSVSQNGIWTVQPGNTANTTAWKVDGSAVTQPVSGTFWQSTQPVSISSMPSTPVTGTFWQNTQPVSGTVSLTASSVSESGVWTVQPGNTANTTAWKVDGSAVTQPVNGTFWQSTQPVSGTVSLTASSVSQNGVWTNTVTQATGSNLHVAVDSAPTTAVSQNGTWTIQPGNTANTTAWKVDGSSVVQPVSISTTSSVSQNGTWTSTVSQATGSNLHTVVDAGSAVIGHVINDASSAVIGHVIVDTTSTTAVTQATGTNLHTVVDSGAITATLAAETTKVIGAVNISATTNSVSQSGVWTSTVTQGTGSNLHTVVDAGSAVIGHVINDAGSAVIGHVIVDTAPSTAVTNAGTFAVQAAISPTTNSVSQSGIWTNTVTQATGSNLHVVVDTAPTTAVTESGTWTIQPGNTANTTPWLASINDGTNTAKVQAASTTPAAADKALTVVHSPNGGNPCINPSATLVSIAGATSTNNATQIIALSGSTKIYICSMTVVGVSGTAPTFSLVQGTGANCVTGQATVVQAFGTTANQSYLFSGPVAVGTAGAALCYKDGGTTPVENYQITYVQQ